MDTGSKWNFRKETYKRRKINVNGRTPDESENMIKEFSNSFPKRTHKIGGIFF